MNKIEIKKFQDQSKELQNQADNLMDEFCKSVKSYLEETRQAIHKEMKDLVESCTNEMRNLCLISATVAPFSLMLLQIDNLDINAYTLIFGFSLMVINILVTQFLVLLRLKTGFKKIDKALIGWIFADSILPMMEDKTQDRTKQLTEFFSDTDRIDESLGRKNIDLETEKIRIALRKNLNLCLILFSASVLIIVFSVLMNPVINSLI